MNAPVYSPAYGQQQSLQRLQIPRAIQYGHPPQLGQHLLAHAMLPRSVDEAANHHHHPPQERPMSTQVRRHEMLGHNHKRGQGRMSRMVLQQ